MAAGTRTPAAEAWRLMHELWLAHKGRMIAIASELDLAPQQMLALHLLDEPRAMGELARALHCDNSNVTGIIDRLEDRGLAERRPAEHDRRVKMLALTPAGQALRERVEERMHEPPPALAALGDDDAQTLVEILRRAV